MPPQTRYARNGDIHLAYQVTGDGPIDLVYIAGQVSHLEAIWDLPKYARFLERLASFSRLIVYDKRGTGASDRAVDLHSIEEQMDDLRCVMDAAGSERAVLFGAQDGASIAMIFAATYPARTKALITFSTRSRFMEAPDYPWGLRPKWAERLTKDIEAAFGDRQANEFLAIGTNPSLAGDPETLDFMMRLGKLSTSPSTGMALLSMYMAADLRPVLPAVSVPTLVLARSDDAQFGPPHARYIAERVPGAKYVEIPGADPFIPAGDLDVITDEIEEFVTGARHAAEIERVLATILYTDFVESTRRSAELGDRAWSDVIDRHDQIVERELERFRGQMVRHTGDGVLARFDGPARGIKCATLIRESVATLGVDIRAGLHTGEVELRGPEPRGIAMNIGARVMETAGAGEILVSQTVKDLVFGSGIEFADRGTHELKGVPGEWHLFAVEA
jgi:class 3 adenylate cyclase/pimeloyl-ACP methyl ester carboxylesterase